MLRHHTVSIVNQVFIYLTGLVCHHVQLEPISQLLLIPLQLADPATKAAKNATKEVLWVARPVAPPILCYLKEFAIVSAQKAALSVTQGIAAPACLLAKTAHSLSQTK